MPALPRPLVAVVAALVPITAACAAPAPVDAGSEPLVPGLEKAVHQSQGRVPIPAVEPLDLPDGEAVELFGRERVEQGYAEAVWFASATTFAAQTLLPGPWQNRGAFTRHTSRLTAGMAEDTRLAVEACWEGDTDACTDVWGWRFYLTDEAGYALQQEGPFVVHHVIDGASASVDRSGGEPHLAVRFEQRGDLRVVLDGQDRLIPLVKDATYVLVPAPEGTGHAWRIDGIDTWPVELDPVPDSGTY